MYQAELSNKASVGLRLNMEFRALGCKCTQMRGGSVGVIFRQVYDVVLNSGSSLALIRRRKKMPVVVCTSKSVGVYFVLNFYSYCSTLQLWKIYANDEIFSLSKDYYTYKDCRMKKGVEVYTRYATVLEEKS